MFSYTGHVTVSRDVILPGYELRVWNTDYDLAYQTHLVQVTCSLVCTTEPRTRVLDRVEGGGVGKGPDRGTGRRGD